MARTVATLPVGNRITDFISLGVIAKTFPVDKVHAILRATGKTSVRQRDLPVGDPAGTSRTSRPSPQQARGQTQDEQLPAPAPNRQTAAACRHPKGDQDTKVNRIGPRLLIYKSFLASTVSGYQAVSVGTKQRNRQRMLKVDRHGPSPKCVVEPHQPRRVAAFRRSGMGD